MRDTTGGHDWHLQEVWAFIDLPAMLSDANPLISEIIMHV